jgi:hypothetical protein
LYPTSKKDAKPASAVPSPAMRALVAGFALVLIACGGATPTASTAPKSADASGDIAPLPYTPEQIRDGCPKGRTIVYRIDKKGAPTARHVMHFDRVDADGAETTSRDESEDGAPIGAPKSGRATWAELQHHADVPRATTTVRDEDVTVPAGTFHCRHYETRASKPEGESIKHMWFANDRPGPPVLMTVDVGGARVMTMTMLSDAVVP